MSVSMFPKMQWAVRALAQPADVQSALFPDFTCKGDELGLSFEEALPELEGQEDQLTDSQRMAIDQLDKLLLSLAGEWNADFWLKEQSLHTDPRWEEIRTRATRVIDAFDWPSEMPDASGDIYIGPN